jgi:UDP-2,3-diacylglucosamine pyrophosphatase LpxH
MKYVITSDVHLGNRHSRAAAFQEFIERLRPDVTLVLGGDVIDDPLVPVEDDHLRALKSVLDRYANGNFIWVRGNHDEGVHKQDDVEEHEDFAIGNRLYVCHGDRFDNVMPHNRWFVKTFGWLHRLRIKMGMHPVHVAQFAKKFKLLYSFLRRNVMLNAVEHAKERGFTHVACGHVHYAETGEKDGVVYFNLGAWTENPSHCLLVDDDGMELIATDDAMKRTDWFASK